MILCAEWARYVRMYRSRLSSLLSEQQCCAELPASAPPRLSNTTKSLRSHSPYYYSTNIQIIYEVWSSSNSLFSSIKALQSCYSNSYEVHRSKFISSKIKTHKNQVRTINYLHKFVKQKILSTILKTTQIWYEIGTQTLIRKLSYKVKEIGFHNNLPLTVSYSFSLRKWI